MGARPFVLLLGIFTGLAISIQAEWFSDQHHGRRGPLVLTMDPSVRSQGLGGAFVAPADDGGALFWNPAGLQKVSRQELSFSHAALFGEQTQDSAVYVRPAWRWGKRETWAVGLTYLADAPLNLVEEGENLGTARPSESVMSLGYSRPLGLGSFGVSGKYIRQVGFEEQGSAYAMDAGIQGALGRRGDWGLSLANVGTEMSLGSSRSKLPLVVRSGVSGRFPFFKGGLLLGTGQIDIPADDNLQVRAGLEYGRKLLDDGAVFLRTGYASSISSRYTVGAGVELKGLAVNYAFSPDDNLGASNRIDFRWKFGAPLAHETRRTSLYVQARAALDKGQLVQAEEALEAARSLSPRDREGKRLQQETSLRMAETLDPATLLDQARRSFAKGDLGGAELAYRKVLLVRPGNSEAQKGVDRLSALLVARRNEEARVALARAKERKKQEMGSRARDAMKRGGWRLALGQWQEILVQDPKNTIASQEILRCREALYQEAVRAEHEGEWEKALSLFRASQDGVDSYRDSADLVKKLLEKEARSRALEAQSRREEGLTKYEEGRAVYRSGNLTQAKILFEEAVRLDPDNQTYRRALERVRQETGPRAP
ncbi:MAG: PorV/PorQ family protein [Elusimicrobia bacterium]|jgi:tetratricopeptide (TPR) repeat protein|nr:PorV/PorQ family protein [Elusimicrobiota bacterium]